MHKTYYIIKECKIFRYYVNLNVLYVSYIDKNDNLR